MLAPGRRLSLLSMCQGPRIAVLEDDYDHEFHYDGRPVLPLASADDAGVVLYVGTLSKILAPGLRIGFVVAPEPLIERLAGDPDARRSTSDRAVERAVAELLGGRRGAAARPARDAYEGEAGRAGGGAAQAPRRRLAVRARPPAGWRSGRGRRRAPTWTPGPSARWPRGWRCRPESGSRSTGGGGRFCGWGSRRRRRGDRGGGEAAGRGAVSAGGRMHRRSPAMGYGRGVASTLHTRSCRRSPVRSAAPRSPSPPQRATRLHTATRRCAFDDRSPRRRSPPGRRARAPSGPGSSPASPARSRAAPPRPRRARPADRSPAARGTRSDPRRAGTADRRRRSASTMARAAPPGPRSRRRDRSSRRQPSRGRARRG